MVLIVRNVLFLWIILALHAHVYLSLVILTPRVAEVINNESATLTCHSNSTNTVDVLFWTHSASPFLQAAVVLSDGECMAIGFLSNTSSFSWSCLGNNTFSVTLKRVTVNNHNDNWTCRQSIERSNKATIFVKVPVNSVRMTAPSGGTVSVLENHTSELSCRTSYGRPEPYITWLFDSGTVGLNDDVVVSEGKSSLNIETKDGLFSAESNLSFTATRSVNNWRIYCNATNVAGQALMSERIPLNVSYPPSSPPHIHSFENGSTYNVLEKHRGQLSCSVSGGNPHATLSWNCYNSGNSSVVTTNTVTKAVSWLALWGMNRKCECHANHGSWHESVFVNVEVLYKASVTRFYVEGFEEQRGVTITEDESAQFNCDIDSNPSSNITLYFQGKTEIYREHNEKKLTYLQENVTCFHSGFYTCAGINEFNNGQPSIDILSLQVKCSPRRSPDTSITAVNAPINGSASFSFKAVAYPEPGPSGFSWQKLIGSKWIQLNTSKRTNITSSALQSNLTIVTVTDADYGKYMLIIKNTVGTYEQEFSLLRSTEDLAECIKEECTGEDSAPIISIVLIILGCSVSILVITVTSLFVILRCRRHQKKKTRRKELTSSVRSYNEVSEMRTISESKTLDQDATVYEEIRPGKDRDIIEKKEQEYDILETDREEAKSRGKEQRFEHLKVNRDDIGSTAPTYSNLAL